MVGQAESAVVMPASQTALCLGRMLSGVTREGGWVVLEVLLMPGVADAPGAQPDVPIAGSGGGTGGTGGIGGGGASGTGRASSPTPDASSDLLADAPGGGGGTGTGDTRPVDGLGSCGIDQNCPASAPMCLNFRCAKCTGNNDCSGRSDGGAGAAVCEPSSGKCVACVKSSECAADPSKPVCVANQCAACSSNSQCSERGGSGAGVCATTSGKCVGCVDE